MSLRPSPSSENSPTPQLDTLLRLKRLERPAPEMLASIEQGFRRRQLATSVPRRRWWHGMPAVRRRVISLGGLATAAAAVALVFSPAANRSLEQEAVRQQVAFQQPVEMLPVEQIFGFREAAPVVVAVQPIIESDFVMDVIERPLSRDARFTMESAPQTLRSGRVEEYAVYTLTAEPSGVRF